MNNYYIENVEIKVSSFTDVQTLISKKVQPMLDMGARKGWKLHTFSQIVIQKGINICLVWEM